MGGLGGQQAGSAGKKAAWSLGAGCCGCFQCPREPADGDRRSAPGAASTWTRLRSQVARFSCALAGHRIQALLLKDWGPWPKNAGDFSQGHRPLRASPGVTSPLTPSGHSEHRRRSLPRETEGGQGRRWRAAGARPRWPRGRMPAAAGPGARLGTGGPHPPGRLVSPTRSHSAPAAPAGFAAQRRSGPGQCAGLEGAAGREARKNRTAEEKAESREEGGGGGCGGRGGRGNWEGAGRGAREAGSGAELPGRLLEGRPAAGAPRLCGSPRPAQARARRRREVRRGQAAAGLREPAATPGTRRPPSAGSRAPPCARGRAGPCHARPVAGLDSAGTPDSLCRPPRVLTVPQSLFTPTQPLPGSSF